MNMPKSARPRPKLTRELLLREIGDDRVRAAVIRFLGVAEENRAHLKWGTASVSIRAVSAGGSRQTVALIYRPVTGWVGAREKFAFGSRSVGEGTPGALRSFLERWTRQFENDDFAELAFTKPEVWNVSYDDAVRNIDLLAERLQTALTEISKL